MKKKGIFISLLSLAFLTACSSNGNLLWGGEGGEGRKSEEPGYNSATAVPASQPDPTISYHEDSSFSEEERDQPHTHYEGSIIQYVPATYDEPGYYIFACGRCGALIYRDIPQLEVDYSVGLEYEINDFGDGYVVTGIGTCTDENIVIPEHHEENGIELPVTEIGDKAFYQITFIITVYCPESVGIIGDKAFSGCENLMEITISDNVDLGVDVFRDTIYVEIVFDHHLIYVPRQESSCYGEGWIAHYECTDCHKYFSDSEGKNQIFDVVIAPSHHFSGGYCTRCGQYQYEVCIDSVDSIPFLGRFPLGTLETAIGLPSEIVVWTMDGYSHSLTIIWDLSTYDKTSIGTYYITGYIQAGGYVFIDSSMMTVTAEIEITDLMIGTADIVFLLDISGSMEDEVVNVKNNLVSFANSVDNAGVSARYSLITFSDYVECPSDANEQTQIIKNGVNNWYTDASAAANAINRISLANGEDIPECDIDALLMANYELDYRQDARRFFILLTDATFKVDNHYGVSSYSETVNILKNNNVCVSVITTSELASNSYYSLYNSTGGTYLSITASNFGTQLTNYLLPIIFQRVED